MQNAAAIECENAPDYSPDPTLTPLQNQVINLLAQGCTITEASGRTGIHRNTIGNWRRAVPAFAANSNTPCASNRFSGMNKPCFWLRGPLK